MQVNQNIQMDIVHFNWFIRNLLEAGKKLESVKNI
jgi:hypothetical protein